jgi:DNA ligase-1
MDAFYEKMRPFQVLSKRRRKYDVQEMIEEVPVCLFVFDLLKLDDEQYIDKLLPQRRESLEEIVEERDELKVVTSKYINTTDELLEFFHQARDDGTEGIIAKSIKDDSIYQAGNRGFLWIKLKGLEGGKLKDSIDVVLVGAFYGKGRRTGVYGTYLGAVYDKESDQFLAFTRIASGWTDEVMEELMEEINAHKVDKKPRNIVCEDEPDEWFSPKIIIEIFGDEITISEKFSTLGYSLRFPVFERIRRDKGIRDVTTNEEIIQLYNAQ